MVERRAAMLQSLQSAVGALQAQNAALRQLVAIHDRLGALVLQGADVTAITRMMADLVGRRVLLLDALLQVRGHGRAGERLRQRRERRERRARGQRPGGRLRVAAAPGLRARCAGDAGARAATAARAADG